MLARGRLPLLLTVLAICGMSTGTALAAPGDLDSSFGAGGKTRADFGGKGKDKLLGGPGKDKLLGEAGKDILRGGPGKDKVKGGAGKDVEKP